MCGEWQLDRRDGKAIIIFEIFLKDRPPCGLTLISPAAMDIACLERCQRRCNERTAMYDPSNPLNSDIQFACNNTRQSGDISSKLTLHLPQIVSKLCCIVFEWAPCLCLPHTFLLHTIWCWPTEIISWKYARLLFIFAQDYGVLDITLIARGRQFHYFCW